MASSSTTTSKRKLKGSFSAGKLKRFARPLAGLEKLSGSMLRWVATLNLPKRRFRAVRLSKVCASLPIAGTARPINPLPDFCSNLPPKYLFSAINTIPRTSTKYTGKVIRTQFGDRNVIDEMLRNGFNFGGEQSGHLIFGDHSTTGDGLVAALQILRIMKSKQKPLSELARCWTRYPQLISNVRVREK